MGDVSSANPRGDLTRELRPWPDRGHSISVYGRGSDCPSGCRLVEDSRKDFGRRIHELLRAHDLSLDALAERTGLHSTYVSGVERRQRAPSLDVVGWQANGLGDTSGIIRDLKRQCGSRLRHVSRNQRRRLHGIAGSSPPARGHWATVAWIVEGSHSRLISTVATALCSFLRLLRDVRRSDSALAHAS